MENLYFSDEGELRERRRVVPKHLKLLPGVQGPLATKPTVARRLPVVSLKDDPVAILVGTILIAIGAIVAAYIWGPQPPGQ